MARYRVGLKWDTAVEVKVEQAALDQALAVGEGVCIWVYLPQARHWSLIVDRSDAYNRSLPLERHVRNFLFPRTGYP